MRPVPPSGGKQLFLCGVECLAVDLHHVVALVDFDARIVNEHAFEPAGNPSRDVGKSCFVVLDLAHHPNIGRHVLPTHGADLNVHEALDLRADRNGANTVGRFFDRN